MASNVGKASVEVVGDVRNFARQVQRDLNAALRRVTLKPLKIELDRTAARNAGQNAGAAAADGFAKGFITRMRALQGVLTAAAFRAGNSAGNGFRRGLDRGSKDSDSFAKKALKSVANILKEGFLGIGKVLGPILGAVGTVVATTFSAAFLVTAASVIGPALAAAITSALGLGLGAALLGVGVLAIKNLKPVQNAFKDLVKTLKQVGQEAAKPLLKPLLGSIEILKSSLKFLQPLFKSIFSGLAPILKPLTAALTGFVSQILVGLRDSLPGIVAAFTGLSRALPVVGKWLGDFFRTIFANSGLIDNTTEGLMKLIFSPLKLLGPIISGLNVGFGVWNNLLRLMVESNVLGQLWQSLVNFVDGGTGAIQRIKDAWGPLGTAIQLVWDKIKAFAGEDDPGKLAQRFTEAVDAIKAAWGPLKDFVGVVWDEMIALVKRLWEEEFMPWWTETAQPWLKEAIGAAFALAWDAAVALVSAKVTEMRNRISAAVQAIPGLIRSALAAVPGIVAGIFRSMVNTAVQQAAILVARAIGILRTLPGKARSAIGGIQNAIIGAFAGAAGWLTGAGRSIIEGLLSGIRAGFGRVRGLLGELTSMLPSWKGPPAVDRKILYGSGQLAMQGFESGLLSEFKSVQRTLGSLTADLSAGFGSRAFGTSSASRPAPSITIAPGAIVIHGTGSASAADTATAVLERLAQANLVRGR